MQVIAQNYGKIFDLANCAHILVFNLSFFLSFFFFCPLCRSAGLLMASGGGI